MPELLDQMYCSQQIVIPPKYPYILKRYCKAAIKTQPYDLLRWSFEYFKALSQNRPPPVKLRLEYPVYSTEGGLTRGCLKVLANQLSSMEVLPISVVKAAWQGFCLDRLELNRILCLCEVYLREDNVPLLNFIAVAGGLLTKTLTHTMILLCESLTKEPDGGSAAIPVEDFITMYKFLANIDASKDVKYFNGYREEDAVKSEGSLSEEEKPVDEIEPQADHQSDSYWEGDEQEVTRLSLIDDHVPRTARLSVKLNKPIMGKIERSPSAERAAQIERENYSMERKGRPVKCEEIEEKLRQKSAAMLSNMDAPPTTVKQKPAEVEDKKIKGVEILVFDEENMDIPLEIHGEPSQHSFDEGYGEEETQYMSVSKSGIEEQMKEEEVATKEANKVTAFVAKCKQSRAQRIKDLEQTFDEIANIVDKFKSANYDLGMVAGRQMSTTSGEFIVQQIERDIMSYIDDQIAILPDPDLKKKKAKPEEVEMIKDILNTFLDENMDVIVPEIEEVVEEEQPIPEITVVYAVPGIGPPVEDDIMREFEKYVFEVCNVQADTFMPRNIRHFMCPPLEKYIEYKYDDDKEELPNGGVITE